MYNNLILIVNMSLIVDMFISSIEEVILSDVQTEKKSVQTSSSLLDNANLKSVSDGKEGG